jgi:hypothetical protein
MFISRVSSKGKEGRTYLSVLLRSSSRVGKKVVSKTLAILTDLPDWLLLIVEQAVAKGKDAASIAELTAAASSRLGLRCAESFGAVFVVHEVAKSCGIAHALGSSDDAKLALWQVCARVLSPATSLLAMIRLAGSCAAARLLGFKTPFNEDDLYLNGSWLVERQAKVEAKLWRWHEANPIPSPDASPDTSPDANPAPDPASDTIAAAPDADPASPPSLFFYDVTSSYFEGSHNALAAFGYNRDRIKGKSQVVMGLLTDATGEPISVSLFPGQTNDLQTFSTQIETLKTTFQQSNITMVGDRGMIRRPQQQEANDAGYTYISALHKAEILTLLKSGELQMGLFDNIVQEVTLQDGRRLVARCNPVRRDEIAASRQGYLTRMEAWVAKANLYLQEHPGARESTQLKLGLQRLQKGKLSVWITLEVKERVIRLQQDGTLLKEHAKLDGCYAIVSDLPPAMASSQELHDRYKDLGKVESGFRTLKHGHLEIRPWYVTSEANTRAHALTAMLALKVRRRLQQAWEPLNLTVEEGLRELGSYSIMEIYEKTSGQSVSRQLPEPNELQAQLIGALGLTLPKLAPAAGPVVVTRVELQKRRKSA